MQWLAKIKKSPCGVCSNHQSQCVCGNPALVFTRCSKCPQPPCHMTGCQPRCEQCWKSVELRVLCQYCRVEKKIGCLCWCGPNEIICQLCFEMHPSLTLPNHTPMYVLSPMTPEKLTLYNQAVYAWAKMYLELGIPRVDLQTLCRVERTPTSELNTALMQAFQQQDRIRANGEDIILEMKLFPTSLSRLIIFLAIP